MALASGWAGLTPFYVASCVVCAARNRMLKLRYICRVFAKEMERVTRLSKQPLDEHLVVLVSLHDALVKTEFLDNSSRRYVGWTDLGKNLVHVFTRKRQAEQFAYRGRGNSLIAAGWRYAVADLDAAVQRHALESTAANDPLIRIPDDVERTAPERRLALLQLTQGALRHNGGR
jgi:hypothetical protein